MIKLNSVTKKINLDHVRLILSFFIIAIHTYPLSFLGDFQDYLFTRIIFRIAVPLYLMITGYYILKKSLKQKEVLINYLKKISTIYLSSIIIYSLFLIKNFSNWQVFLRDIFFTGPFYHLWYFPALILGIITTYYIIKYIPEKYQIIICAILYFIGILGDNYYGFLHTAEIFTSFYKFVANITGYTRNFLFYVPIFLMLGYKISKEEKSIEKRANIIYIIKFLILMILEGTLIYRYSTPLHTSMYFALPFLSYFIFKYLITYLNKETNKNIREASTIIYIIHPWFIIILTKINIIKNSLVFYLIICLFSYLISLLYLKIKRQIQKLHLT